jgi:hypothetical protein
VDAHDVHRNSTLYCSSEWSAHVPFAHCLGFSHHGNAGSALGFHGLIDITWCAHDTSLCKDHVHHSHATLPPGYSRWIQICTYLCIDYILGAVKMPNGPIALIAGKTGEHMIHASSHDDSRVEHQGGPLFLYVGHHSTHNDGNHVRYGYVFGFRGWLYY